jgi:uncharacterized protein
MNLLVCNDIHGSTAALKKLKKKAANSDIILCSGDFTIFGHDIEKILEEFDSWKKPVLLITGNHEDPEEVQEIIERFDNLILLNDKAYEIGNLLFIGIEGNGFSKIDPLFEEISSHFKPFIKEKRKEFKNKKEHLHFILMTHAPPYGTLCDLLVEDEHCGNKSIRDFIIKTKPDINICGHIHENNESLDSIKDTVIMNPGPYGRIISFKDNKMILENQE